MISLEFKIFFIIYTYTKTDYFSPLNRSKEYIINQTMALGVSQTLLVCHWLNKSEYQTENLVVSIHFIYLIIITYMFVCLCCQLLFNLLDIMMIMLDFSLLIGDLSLFKETLKKVRWWNVFVCLFVFFPITVSVIKTYDMLLRFEFIIKMICL